MIMVGKKKKPNVDYTGIIIGKSGSLTHIVTLSIFLEKRPENVLQKQNTYPRYMMKKMLNLIGHLKS